MAAVALEVSAIGARSLGGALANPHCEKRARGVPPSVGGTGGGNNPGWEGVGGAARLKWRVAVYRGESYQNSVCLPPRTRETPVSSPLCV